MRERKGYVLYDKKSESWIARTSVTDDNGKRRFIKRRPKSKTDAEAKLKVLLRLIDDDGSRVVDYSLLTFDHLPDYYEKDYLKPAVYVGSQKVSGLRDVSRTKELLKHFRVHFGKKKLREITYGDLVSHREERFKVPTPQKRQRTISSWNREAAVLRRIFNIARQQGWILRNPFHGGDPLIIVSAERPREKILTVAEEQRLLDACNTHPYRRPLKPLLMFLIDTGSRKGEALKLR